MRGNEQRQGAVFSYVSLEQRVPSDHPLRTIRKMVDQALVKLSEHFDGLYANTGRPSIAPEKLLRALLLQALYGKRGERLLMEELDYSLLFRWFVGLAIDDEVWDATVFSKNRDRLIAGEVAIRFFAAVRGQLEGSGLLSDEHCCRHRRRARAPAAKWPKVAGLRSILAERSTANWRTGNHERQV